MNKAFPEVKKNFGFGCMRLAMNGDEVNKDIFDQMIDAFIGAGFNYYDTAHGYIGGKSEKAIRDCLVARYPREAYLLTDKLSLFMIDKKEDVAPFFEDQLKCCGVDYFDFYLIHALDRGAYRKALDFGAFEFVSALKEQGRIKHIGISFHDTAEVLDRILSEQPEIEAVQLQINYLDYDDPAVQSKACYDVAVKHGKKVIVMEPVKGGALVNLPEAAEKVLDELNGGSYASYAIRYAASYPEVFMVLSGMGSMEMMEDNLGYMTDFVPLSDAELAATDKVREIVRTVDQVPCTGCEYCMDPCPMDILMPRVFAAFNSYLAAKATRGEAREALGEMGKKATECIECGACAAVCPQKIEIPEQLKKAVKALRLDK